jgi:Peptidase C13 family
MIRSMPRLPLRLCAIAFLLLGLTEAFAARPAPAGWQAVLVAGDNAQPVFDRAVNDFGNWLTSRGVPSSDIHRLSASRDPAIEPASRERVLRRIASLQPGPGERCLIFITSHGQRGQGVWLAAEGRYLRPEELAQALSVGCAAVPTVVIISSCYSGAFAEGAMAAPNRIILTAARADRPSFGCQADRTYTVFDECLLDTLQGAVTWRQVFNRNAACVSRHETQLRVQPSEPQKYFGPAARNLPLR